MKPDWENAPKWAQWVAMDADGAWYWHEEKPHINRMFIWVAGVKSERVHFDKWEETLEQRPETL